VNWFPQIGSGSIAQFPITRSRQWRNIVNVMESGEHIALPDASGGLIEWNLTYQDLTAPEVGNLNTLFQSSQGRFAPFTFVDPLANLLGWSENLSQPNWQCGLLQVTAGVNDPLGTQRASSVVNGTGGVQAITQSLSIAGALITCFSAWIRSDSGAQITLARDGSQVNASVTPSWTRVYVGGGGASGATASTFSLGIAGGQSIDVWGLQVEAQPFPSKYKSTAAAYGIYEETYFASDQLTVAETAPGLSACTIQLVSRVSG
jgi:hypothetical protein